MHELVLRIKDPELCYVFAKNATKRGHPELALQAFRELTLVEGIMPALESSHALAYARRLAERMRPDQSIVVNLSGRGDKDILTVAEIDGISF